MTAKHSIALWYSIAALVLFLGAGCIIYTAYAYGEDGRNSAVALPVKKREPLSIVTQQGHYDFQIEVVQRQSEMQRGLMFREDVPEKTGMLFDFGLMQRISMWMKTRSFLWICCLLTIMASL